MVGGHGEVRLPNGNVEAMIENGDQMAKLMLIFSIGYLAVFAVFVLLYLHAYRKRHELQLNELELFDTRNSIQESALNCGIAILSTLIVLVGGPRFAGVAGIAYMLTGVALGTNGALMGKRRRRLEKVFTEKVELERA
jgi:hypothetical protein